MRGENPETSARRTGTFMFLPIRSPTATEGYIRFDRMDQPSPQQDSEKKSPSVDSGSTPATAGNFETVMRPTCRSFGRLAFLETGG